MLYNVFARSRTSSPGWPAFAGHDSLGCLSFHFRAERCALDDLDARPPRIGDVDDLAAVGDLARHVVQLDAFRGDLPHELDALHDGLQIDAVLVVALREVTEVDERRVARVVGAEVQLARGVVRVRLEDRPGEIVAVLWELGRVAGRIAAERAEQREAEEVRQRPLRKGAQKDG